MKRHHHLPGLVLVMVLSASAWGQESSCLEIRAEIGAHVGQVAKPNIELLRKISSRSECRFRSAEVYRAASADNPAHLAARKVGNAWGGMIMMIDGWSA